MIMPEEKTKEKTAELQTQGESELRRLASRVGMSLSADVIRSTVSSAIESARRTADVYGGSVGQSHVNAALSDWLSGKRQTMEKSFLDAHRTELEADARRMLGPAASGKSAEIGRAVERVAQQFVAYPETYKTYDRDQLRAPLQNALELQGLRIGAREAPAEAPQAQVAKKRGEAPTEPERRAMDRMLAGLERQATVAEVPKKVKEAKKPDTEAQTRAKEAKAAKAEAETKKQQAALEKQKKAAEALEARKALQAEEKKRLETDKANKALEAAASRERLAQRAEAARELKQQKEADRQKALADAQAAAQARQAQKAAAPQAPPKQKPAPTAKVEEPKKEKAPTEIAQSEAAKRREDIAILRKDAETTRAELVRANEIAGRLRTNDRDNSTLPALARSFEEKADTLEKHASALNLTAGDKSAFEASMRSVRGNIERLRGIPGPISPSPMTITLGGVDYGVNGFGSETTPYSVDLAPREYSNMTSVTMGIAVGKAGTKREGSRSFEFKLTKSQLADPRTIDTISKIMARILDSAHPEIYEDQVKASAVEPAIAAARKAQGV